MYVAEYQTWFLTLESFAPGNFACERERIAQLVLALCVSICSVGAMLTCSRLAEEVMRILECEYAHKSHQAKGTSQSSHQGQRNRSQDQHGPQ